MKKSKGEEVLYSGIQTASSQNEFQTVPERLCLVKTARRPTASRTCEFEGSKRCNKLGRGDQAGSNIDNFCNFHKHTSEKVYDDLGRGEQRGVRRIRLPVKSRSISPHCRETTTQKSSSREEDYIKGQPTNGKQKSLSRIGWPTRQQTGFHQRELSQQPLRFRKLNRRPLGFRSRLCKLNRRQFELKAHEHLVTCNQHDMHRLEKLERHPPELSSHVKFIKLNRSLRLGFRMSELQTMIASDNIKECRITIQHRLLGRFSGCSHPLQISRQSKESSQNKQLSSTKSSAGAHHH